MQYTHNVKFLPARDNAVWTKTISEVRSATCITPILLLREDLFRIEQYLSCLPRQEPALAGVVVLVSTDSCLPFLSPLFVVGVGSLSVHGYRHPWFCRVSFLLLVAQQRRVVQGTSAGYSSPPRIDFVLAWCLLTLKMFV